MAASAMSEKVWYFAYGSNMSTAKFTGDRGIQPLAKIPVVVPGWALAMSVPGLPYAEPAFSAVEAKEGEEDKGGAHSISRPDVQGVLYLITHRQYIQVTASEGGGTAYDAAQITAVPLLDADGRRFGSRIKALTLVAALTRCPRGRGSLRYMVSCVVFLESVAPRCPLPDRSYIAGLTRLAGYLLLDLGARGRQGSRLV